MHHSFMTMTWIRFFTKLKGYLPNTPQILGILWRRRLPAHTATHCWVWSHRPQRSTCWWHTLSRSPLHLLSYTLCRKNKVSSINISKREIWENHLSIIWTLHHDQKHTHSPLANSFMRDGKLVKVRMGMRANGNYERKARMTHIQAWCDILKCSHKKSAKRNGILSQIKSNISPALKTHWP